MHAQRVGPVGGDRDVDDRIDLARIVRRQPVHEPLADLARRQLDDAVVLVGKLHLALRRHHPGAFDAAHLGHLDRRVDARNVGARMRHNDRDPLPRVGRTADDLLLALVGDHAADAQTVGVGMLARIQHLADGEVRQTRRRVGDALDLEPEVGQRLGDLGHRRLGFQMFLQPRQRESHARPPDAVRARVNRSVRKGEGPAPEGCI